MRLFLAFQIGFIVPISIPRLLIVSTPTSYNNFHRFLSITMHTIANNIIHRVFHKHHHLGPIITLSKALWDLSNTVQVNLESL